jgi:hypothetical protein
VREATPDAVAEKSFSARAIIMEALLASWPALYYMLANTACFPEMDAVHWVAIVLVLLLCLAVVYSSVGMAKLCATAGSADADSLPQLAPGWPKAGWARIAGSAAAGAGQLSHWIVPSIWLFLTSGLGSYIVSAIWPQIPIGSLWILFPLAVVLAFGLSYVPSRGVGDICLTTICVIQVALVIVFSIMAAANYRAAQWPGKGPKYTAYYLDSTGNSTPYLQDSTSDGRTKVDPQGNPVWVYNATVKGDSLEAPDNHTPDVASAPAPFALRYFMAMTCGVLLSVAAFQFIASLGSRRKYKRPVIRSLTILLLILVQCGGFYLIQRFTRSPLLDDRASFHIVIPSNIGPAPMGDLLVIFGTWAIGSYRAGWWLMLSQTLILLLVLIAAAWTCLDSAPGVAWTFSQQGPVAGHGRIARRSHWHILRRAGITVLLCAIMFQQTYGNSAVNASAGGTLANATALPVLFSILLSSVSLSTMILCTMICLMSWATVPAHPFRKVAKYGIAPVIGLAAGLACIAAQLAGPVILGWKNDQELLWALLLCAAWGAGIAITHCTHRAPP